MLKVKVMAGLAALLVLSAPAQPANAFQVKRIETGLGMILRLRGDLRAGDYGRLKATLQDPAVVGLEIRSGGGSLEDGFEIARAVQEKGLVVYASKECDSVCAVIFFAAKERHISRGGKIGVHSVSNDRGKEDADSARVTLKMSRLLVGLGVPHSIIGKIVATPPARMTYLDNRDLAALNVHRTNPFRTNYGAVSVVAMRPAGSICGPAVDVGAEPASALAQRTCSTPVPHASAAP